MKFENGPAGWYWIRLSHETADNMLTRDVVMGGSRTEGSTLKMDYSHSYRQEASVPYHTGFSIGLLE